MGLNAEMNNLLLGRQWLEWNILQHICCELSEGNVNSNSISISSLFSGGERESEDRYESHQIRHSR